MKRIIIFVGVVFALSLVSMGQSKDKSKDKSDDGNTEQLILRLENEGREATLKDNLAANDRLLADNWININADGSVTTKAKLIELLKADSFTILSIENDEVMVRVFGDAAIATGRSTTKRAGQGTEILTRQVRFTRVYAKNHGRWQVVSAHNTPIRQP
jgi:ketosteroid isomerase-like protein